MMLHLARRKPCSIVLPFFAHFCSASATQNPVPKPSIFSLNDYLVGSWGFFPDKAARFSKRLTHLKSPEKPDAVLRFLNREGFSNAEIQKLVTWYPNLLSSCPETILEPNLNALRNMGLSSSTLNTIILANPGALQLHSAVPRIKFWLDFFGGDETILVKAFKLSSINFVGQDITKNIAPKISFLHSHGFSTHHIQRMVCMIPRFMAYSIAWMEELLERAKELGFQPESGMFVLGLKAVSCISREGLHKKMLVFKNFGWEEHEFLSALRKAPRIGQMSEENLREKIDFLLREAKADLSHITSRPVVLTYSLEKRLRPYLRVLHLLESKGLFSKGKGEGLCSVMSMTNSKFVERFILPHQDEIPELHNAFLATRRS